VLMHAATHPRYDLVAMCLHWLLALAILAGIASGLYAASLPFSPARLRWVNWHKWMGVAVLAVSFVRLGWRVSHRPPPLPLRIRARMPGWQLRAHQTVHGLMYALFFAVPLSGWSYSSAAGVSIVWLGVLPLPDFISPDRALADSLRTAHQVLAYGLCLLVCLHLAAVFKHALLDQDGLMQRMLPDLCSKQSTSKESTNKAGECP